MNKIQSAIAVVRHLGPEWVSFRVRYALRCKMGLLVKRTPTAAWRDIAVQPATRAGLPLFVHPVTPGIGAIAEADEILAGRFRLFSFHRVEAGFPPQWHRNPLTGEQTPANKHWSRFGDFALGDIKSIWELSRFSWAFPLARAYAQAQDNKYAEGFWILFENWMVRNAPNHGPNWMCGQEAAFRLMAATFAFQVCSAAPATTGIRRDQFLRFAAVTGRRVAANIDYALSQSNNHGVSEAVGLITAASLLRETPETEVWRTKGFAALEQQLADLVYSDGGFSQHSTIYHRVLLHDLLWCVNLLQSSSEEVPSWLANGGKRALGFIESLMTPETGCVPLYGANDGANVLPLADADYLDFRPVVQASYALLYGHRRLSPGPWDEAAEWLAPGFLKAGGKEDRSGGLPAEGLAKEGVSEDQKVSVPEGRGRTTEDGSAGFTPNNSQLITNNWRAAARLHFPDAGCFVWRSGDARLFFRCPTKFRHRPSQADLLHVDIEWKGMQIARDAGTYSYNTVGQFKGALKEAAVHNTVTFDGKEPMENVSRFLYLPWTKGTVRWNEADPTFEATHDGWRRLGLNHERRLGPPVSDWVVVTDRVLGAGRHLGRLHWLLVDLPYRFEPESNRLVLATPAGDYAVTWTVAGGAATLVRADSGTARGWWSPYYLHAAPALSLAIEFNFEGEIEISTTFGPL